MIHWSELTVAAFRLHQRERGRGVRGRWCGVGPCFGDVRLHVRAPLEVLLSEGSAYLHRVVVSWVAHLLEESPDRRIYHVVPFLPEK